MSEHPETEQEMLRRHNRELIKGRPLLDPNAKDGAEDRRLRERHKRELLALRASKGKRTEVALLRSALRRFEDAVEEWPQSDYNRGVRDALRYALGQAFDPAPEERPPGGP